ncbi:MAG: Dam family site-specific DNA-(adenine-N6)-methyltransferase [Vicinamibacterales bacterium]
MAPAFEARPFLKWAGGKRQLLPVLRQYYPAAIQRYLEPFMGSGAVFFDLRASGRLEGRPVLLSDENPDLVGCYFRVRDSVDAVLAELERLAAGHAAGERTFYYEVRDGHFNPARAAWLAAGGDPAAYPVPLAAALLYLNRTGYNGLFRLNRSGGYNVPAGRYVRPRIVDEPRLRAAAAALGRPGIEIACRSFDERGPGGARGLRLLRSAMPRWDRRRTSGTTPPGGSPTATKARLQALAVTLAGRGVHVLLSNSSADSIVRLYGQPVARSAGLRIRRVPARRAINTKAERRGPVDELVVSNLAPVA